MRYYTRFDISTFGNSTVKVWSLYSPNGNVASSSLDTACIGQSPQSLSLLRYCNSIPQRSWMMDGQDKVKLMLQFSCR